MINVTVQNLTRSFGERPVLTGVDLELHPGDRLVVKGHNGSGKSTFVRILAGLLRPSSGTVLIERDGKPLDEAERRVRVGYLAPDLVIYEHLTVLENLEFFARVRGLPRGDALAATIRRVGLEGREDDLVGTLSTGLRQRAKLAFSTQTDPDLLLLDEPSANLDSAGRALVEEATVTVAERGGIVVLASNDPLEFALGTRDIVLA